MAKHIILADSTVGAGRRYIASSRGVATSDITEVALFASEAAAAAAASKLLTRDFERTHNVTLLLGTVTFTVETTKAVPRKEVSTGYVIRRHRGDYYQGPKTKPPRDFRDAHYMYVANRDKATVFPSQTRALEYADLCRQILKQTADDELRSTHPSPTYQQLYDEFRYTVEAV
jgi:hypothetical protein